MNKSKIYTPKIISEAALGILQEAGYAGELPAGTKDGFIKTSLEQDVAIQRISHDLYQHAASGFRELYVNEARACRYAKKHHGADPRIEITIDPEKRLMVIEGVDSMGMTWDVFQEVYTVLGRSTNFDGEESGQFGFGRAAYTCLSEIMIMEVNCRETNEKFAVMGRNGIGFQTGLPTPKSEHYGTKITLTLYENIDYGEIEDMIREVSLLSEIPTVLHLKNKLLTGGYIKVEAGTYNLGPTTIDEVFKEETKKAYYGREQLEWIGVEISDKDIDARIAFALYENTIGKRHKTYSLVGHGHTKSYLVRVPIEYKYSGMLSKRTAATIINIKNERKYPPTPDRERLKDESMQKISEKIESALIKQIQKRFSIESLHGYQSSRQKFFLDAMFEGNKEELYRIFSENMMNVLEAAHWPVFGKDNKKTLLKYCTPEQKMIVTTKNNKSKIAAAEKTGESLFVFRPENAEESLGKFTSIGIQTLEEYIKENSLEVKRLDTKTIDAAVHYSEQSWSGDSQTLVKKSDRIRLDKFDEKVIVAGPSFNMLCALLRQFKTEYKVVKHLKEITKGVPETEFFEKIATKSVITSDGDITLSELQDTKKKVVLLNYPQKEGIAPLMKSMECVFVIGTTDELYEAMAHMKHQGQDYLIAVTSSYELDKDLIFELQEYSTLFEEQDYFSRWQRRLDDVPVLSAIIHGERAIKDANVKSMFLESVKNRGLDSSVGYKHASEMLQTALSIDASLQTINTQKE